MQTRVWAAAAIAAPLLAGCAGMESGAPDAPREPGRNVVVERVRREPAFARALLDEAGSLFLNGDPAMARVVLRDLVNATVGFEGLASATERPSKSLHRMLSATGNPSMDNLAAIFDVLRRSLQVDIEVRAA